MKMVSAQLTEYALKKFEDRKKYYGPILPEIERGMEGCTPEEAHYMRFLYGTMPVRDAGEYEFDVFFSYVRHSLWLRENAEWCRELPEDIFLHHVLYHRINSEDIRDCRAFFYEKLKDRIAGLSLEEAVREINYWCAENAVYESTDGRTASPMTMYRSGKGRCGEESTFAVTAYRSAGIASRQVYTPRWAHCDDNHAWVEVYLGEKWCFLGACEPEEVLNRGWFSAPASRAVLIHSRTFSDFTKSTEEERIGREGLLTYYNQTPFYARTRKLEIEVKDRSGRPAAGARVALEILNMAEYYPAAVLTADENGRARITAGLGDVRLFAFQDGMFAEEEVSLEKTGQAVLTLSKDVNGTDWAADEWERSVVRAPEEYLMHPGRLTKEEKERGEKRLEKANHLREARFRAYFKEELAAACPQEAEMLRTAGENFDEVYAFLKRDENPDRRSLLHSLAVKDYKDLRADILEDHLSCERGEYPEEIYEKYVLCPRIWLEELTPWRSFIRGFFSEEDKRAFSEDPEKIWRYIRKNIACAPEEDYPAICATPVGCLKLSHGNTLAQKILFAAICRSLDIPARMNGVTMLPEYYREGRFIVPEGLEPEKTGEPAALTLRTEDGNRWNYFQTWTIGVLKGAGFETLGYEGLRFENNALTLELAAGVYRLITTQRMPDGSQHVSRRVFVLKAGEKKSVEMTFGETNVDDLTVNRKLEDFSLIQENGEKCMLSELLPTGTSVLAFLGVGAEPTEHVLNELLDCAPHWNEAGARMIAVLRSQKELDNATLRRVRSNVTGIRVCFDSGENAAQTAEIMGVDADKLPVLAVVKEGLTGIYACAGYNVGSVDLALKLTERTGNTET